jgi:hypothetical protein
MQLTNTSIIRTAVPQPNCTSSESWTQRSEKQIPPSRQSLLQTRANFLANGKSQQTNRLHAKGSNEALGNSTHEEPNIPLKDTIDTRRAVKFQILTFRL